MKTELLAPAGDIEAGYAALYYGADAVYLGLQKFSARATAVNFDAETLADFTGYAHALGRKVYVTVNTILQTREMPDLLNTLNACVTAGVDAVIVQDLGVARVIKESYPELVLHASTQMAVHNLAGALALKEIGFERVVLARELTFDEIRQIKEKAGVEIEVFVHGALCYSYSGLCLFSSLTTGKSANRGKCLYPCRACFKDDAGRQAHLFSMKDLALSEDVLKMPGVSLKIEGRKKNALYVAAVTDYYRTILDGKGADPLKEERLKQIFARPWTKLHTNGKNKNVTDPDFVGHRGLPVGKVDSVVKGVLSFKPTHALERYDGIQMDVPGQEKPYGFSLEKMRVQGRFVFKAEAGRRVEIILPPNAPFIRPGTPVYLASSSAVKGAYPYEKPKPGSYASRQPADVSVRIETHKITVSAKGVTVERAGLFESAHAPEKVSQAVRKAFEKTGDTPFVLRDLTIHNPAGLFVPASLLNDMRRSLYAQMPVDTITRTLPEVTPIQHAKTPRVSVKTDDAACLALLDLNRIDEVIIMLSLNGDDAALRQLPKNKVRLALPAVCRHPAAFEKRIQSLLAQGYKKWEIGHVWGLSVLPRKGIDLSFDSSIYTMNPQAVEMAKKMGASRVTFSAEDTLENMKLLVQSSPLPMVLPVYTDPPLFISANCVRENDCRACDHQPRQSYIHANGQTYLILSQDCQTTVYADKPLSFIEEARDIHPDFIRADFVGKTYTLARVREIMTAVLSGQSLPGAMKGNLTRGL